MTTVEKPKRTDPKEPIAFPAIGTLFGTLIVNLVIALGLPIAPDLKVPLVAIVSLLAPTILAGLARNRVWSPASVAELLEEATRSGVSTAPITQAAPWGGPDQVDVEPRTSTNTAAGPASVDMTTNLPDYPTSSSGGFYSPGDSSGGNRPSASQ